jgi:hypothetical protein
MLQRIRLTACGVGSGLVLRRLVKVKCIVRKCSPQDYPKIVLKCLFLFLQLSVVLKNL